VPIVVVRASGLVFGAMDIDECDYLVAARMIAAGELPYVGLLEKKPLLSFAFYAPSGLFGFHLWPMQLAAMAWILGTCLVVAKAAREWTGREEAAWAAGWLACLAQVASRPSVNCETMLNLPAAAALLFFVRAERSRRLRHDVLTGVAVGVATLFKQQAGIMLVSLLASLAWKREAGPDGEPPPRTARAAALVAGVAAPWAAAAALYAAIGHLSEFVEWNVTRNLAYGAHGGGSALERLALGVLLGVVLTAPLQWVLAAREAGSLRRGSAGRDPVLLGLALTLGLVFVPVSMGGRFYDHYFIQFAPVVALLAAPGAVRILDAWPALARARRWLIGGALVVPLASYVGIFYGAGLLGRLPLQEPRTRELARWIKAHSAPEDRLFVWGHFTPIYVLSERLPGTRYYNSSVLVGDFDPHHLPEGFDFTPYVSQPDVALTLRDLDTNRPAFFVDTAPADIHEWHRVPLGAVPALEAYLHQHYDLVAQPAGAAVYQRR
jgi:Dolichyl-phosphate-mannose-protein mannosyltransferase